MGQVKEKERPGDRVEIHHPSHSQTATVTRKAFERVWKERGWRLGAAKEKEATS